MTLFESEPQLSAADPGPPDGASRVRMVVAYQGTNFHGFAAQHNQRTVAAVLVTAIERFVGHTVELACAGRTDSGVHAWGQVVHADLVPPRDAKWTAAELARRPRAVTKMLGPEAAL